MDRTLDEIASERRSNVGLKYSAALLSLALQPMERLLANAAYREVADLVDDVVADEMITLVTA